MVLTLMRISAQLIRRFSNTGHVRHNNPLGLPPLKDNVEKDKANLRKQMARGLPTKEKIKGVTHVVAVASGKGGVGKSTVAVNLALGISKLQKKVALLDADLFGPSIPRMMNLQGSQAELTENGLLRPLKNHGISCMSIGFLIKNDNDESSPVVWRGLMVMKALEQLLRQVEWGSIEYLIIDMPPGTGDTQLTISQTVPVSGAVIVSTPQEIALIDAKKGVSMFQKVNIPILGLVQNMSYFECKCGEKTHLFGKEGVKKTAEKMGVPLLADLPLDVNLQIGSDIGKPITVTNPESASAKTFFELAQKVVSKLETK
jgi:ATP-binding protein involved in chromosome partitioning